MVAYNQHLGDDYMDTFNRPSPSRQHSITRTSPKGDPFVGTCALCGTPNLTFDDMRTECENPRGLSTDEAVMEAVAPPGSDRASAEGSSEPNPD